jgi:hypothetical protein
MMTAMRMHGSLVLAALALAPGCGDDGGGDGTAGSTGVSSTSVGTTDGIADTTDTAHTTGGPGETTASTGETTAGSTTFEPGTDTTAGPTTDGSTTDGSTTDGPGMLDAQLANLQIFQDCMPIVPADPVGANALLELTNLGDGPVAVTVTSAAFRDVGGMQVATLGVVPAAFGPIAVGAVEVAAVAKVGDSLVPAAGCGVLQCGALYTLELVLDADGTEVIASDAAPVDCVF